MFSNKQNNLVDIIQKMPINGMYKCTFNNRNENYFAYEKS